MQGSQPAAAATVLYIAGQLCRDCARLPSAPHGKEGAEFTMPFAAEASACAGRQVVCMHTTTLVIYQIGAGLTTQKKRTRTRQGAILEGSSRQSYCMRYVYHVG
jgi:hypothetical protein